MKYRCPYCKTELGTTPPPRCPTCQRVMIVPAMKELSERAQRQRKIDNIWRECEREKQALGVVKVGLVRNPKYYLGIVLVLGVLGSLLFKAADRATPLKIDRLQDRVARSVDALAVALGRYHFHTGEFPSAKQGLSALVLNPGVRGWDGPYIRQLVKDPWGSPYIYAPPTNDAPFPLLLSLGEDQLQGTADDIIPAPERFDPGTEWTNGWVSAYKRRPVWVIKNTNELQRVVAPTAP